MNSNHFPDCLNKRVFWSNGMTSLSSCPSLSALRSSSGPVNFREGPFTRPWGILIFGLIIAFSGIALAKFRSLIGRSSNPNNLVFIESRNKNVHYIIEDKHKTKITFNIIQ